MSVSKTVKYDEALPLEKQLERSLSPADLEWRRQHPQNLQKPHLCDPPKLTLESGIGPGSIWVCNEGDNPCGMQKQCVYLGVKQLDDSLPLGWRNLGRIGV